MFVHNLAGEIRQIDTLANIEVAPFREIDSVVAEPPMNMHWLRQSELLGPAKLVKHLPWGVPTSLDATWIFAQLAYSALKPSQDGKAVVATSRGSLNAGFLRQIRLRAPEDHAYEAITLLPAGTSSLTKIERFLLTLKTKSQTGQKSQVTVVDARELFSKSGRYRGSAREITPNGMTLITQALSDKRPTKISRTVASQQLLKKELRIKFEQLSNAELSASISHWLPGERDEKKWFKERYASSVNVSLDKTLVNDVNLTGQWFFERAADESNHAHSLPLSALVSAFQMPSPNRNDSLSQISMGTEREGPWIVVNDKSAELHESKPQALPEGESGAQKSSSWDLAFQLEGELTPEYVVAFLNSENGLNSFYSRSGIPAKFGSVGIRLQLLDAIRPPQASQERQQQLISAVSGISAVRAKLDDDAAAIWKGSLEVQEFASRANTYLGLEPLIVRLQSWPNPIASVAWMVETASETPAEMERAINRFWEAVTGFHSSILLSAIRGIPDLEAPALEDIRRGVSGNGHLRFEEASTGLFSLFATTCMRKVRNMILDSSKISNNDSGPKTAQLDTSEPDRNDQIEQIVSAFGGLSIHLIEKLVSKELAQIFERSRPYRTIGVHGGTETKEAQSQRVSDMYSLIQEWDVHTRPIWASYQLVRAGASHRNKAMGYYEQQVEFMVGNSYPFATSKVKVVDAYGSGDVYMHCSNAMYGLELVSPLFEFQEWPEEARIACYFYNRDNGETMDLKSFVALPQSNINRSSLPISNTLHWLKGNQ